MVLWLLEDIQVWYVFFGMLFQCIMGKGMSLEKRNFRIVYEMLVLVFFYYYFYFIVFIKFQCYCVVMKSMVEERRRKFKFIE